MRVMMVNTLYPPIVHGGQELFVALLAQKLVKAGDSVSVLSLHSGADEVTEDRDGVRVYRVPLDNVYWPFEADRRRTALAKMSWHARDSWNFRASRRAAQFLDREQPEVVHTHGLSGFSVALWALARKRRLRVVHTLHDFYLLCKNSAMFRGGHACKTRCAECRLATAPRKWATPQVNAVVSISDFVLREHQRYSCFNKTPSSVVYNIIEGTACTAQASSDFKGMVFGYIGRLEQEKGIDLLLAATRLLHGEWRLRIAGRGEAAYVADLKREYSGPRLEWLGFIDPHSFYSDIRVCVVPSVWPEPMGRVLIEAFAAGKAVICAASGGLTEMAAFGHNVHSYPAEDVQALAKTMQHWIDNPGLANSGGFRDETARELFSEGHVVNQYRKIYSDVQS